MTVFDPGLQPERTQLAWRRTAIAIAVGSIVSLRVLPVLTGSGLWVIPGAAGVAFAAWMWAVARRRFVVFDRDLAAEVDSDVDRDVAEAADGPRMPGAAALLAIAAFVVGAGAVALLAFALAPTR